jgi:hypothetical protein
MSTVARQPLSLVRPRALDARPFTAAALALVFLGNALAIV